MKFTIQDQLAGLPLPATEKWKKGIWDVEAFRKGAVSLIFFAPNETDYQTSHTEDEFYFIVRGTGDLIIAHERFPFETGDAFFVPAGTEHHFENFSNDFATWAIFFET